jgi:hypothetical protein
MSKGIFTQVTLDDNFLPHWLKYYRPNFDECVIIVKELRPGSAELIDKLAKEYDSKVVLFEYPSDHPLNQRDNPAYINEVKNEYLRRHKWICYAQADEFLVPDPKIYKNLSEYIECMDKWDKQYSYAEGYTVVHDYDNEPSMDWTQPLLQQRKYWYRNVSYNKPMIMNYPHELVGGFHKFKIHTDPDVITNLPDVNLRMLHLDAIDLGMMLYRSRHRVNDDASAKKYIDQYKENREPILERYKVF